MFGRRNVVDGPQVLRVAGKVVELFGGTEKRCKGVQIITTTTISVVVRSSTQRTISNSTFTSHLHSHVHPDMPPVYDLSDSSSVPYRSTHPAVDLSSNSSFCIAPTTPSSQASTFNLLGKLFSCIALWTAKFGLVSDPWVSTGGGVEISERGLTRSGWRNFAYR
jgi:hypothetical protein